MEPTLVSNWWQACQVLGIEVYNIRSFKQLEAQSFSLGVKLKEEDKRKNIQPGLSQNPHLMGRLAQGKQHPPSVRCSRRVQKAPGARHVQEDHLRGKGPSGGRCCMLRNKELQSEDILQKQDCFSGVGFLIHCIFVQFCFCFYVREAQIWVFSQGAENAQPLY